MNTARQASTLAPEFAILQQGDVPDLLSREQAAAYLGVAAHTLAIWKCTKRHNLPYVKIGRLIKYRRSELDAFIHRNSAG